MTHKLQMAADVVSFLNVNEFADSIYYNGATAAISAVVEIGEDAANGNTFTSAGSAARCIVNVAATAIPSPAVGAAITHLSRTWHVARVLETDGIMHRIECTASESAW